VPVVKQEAWGAGWTKILRRQSLSRLFKLLFKSMISVILCAGSAVCAQSQEAQTKSTDESWTATTQTSVDNTNPLRTTESHAKFGNRTVDKQRVEALGLDGRYQPVYDTEKETTQVSATTRTVIRGYRFDADGRRILVQVTEEEAQSSTSGDTHVVRTTSDSDVNGHFRITQREVADTRKTNPNAQETKTTVYLNDGTGSLTPYLKTQELQKRAADLTVEVTKTTLRPDGNGSWEVAEVNEKTMKEDGNNRTTEERLWRPDSEGRLSEISRTADKETETAVGEKSKTVETYSPDIPGVARDGRLRLNQRVTTVQKKGSDTSEQQVERPLPGEPSSGLRVTAKTKYTVLYAASGAHQTAVTQERDINGSFNVVSSETRTKSDEVPAARAPTAPSNPPK
jgi:hypothetical protein